jgi:hypothetical protein
MLRRDNKPVDNGNDRQRVHGVVFDDPEHALSAVKTLRSEGFEVLEVYSPFPVHGMEEAMGLRKTRLPYATFVGGFAGCSLGLGFQLWTHTVDWPLDIGGKSDAAIPGLIPVTFEITVLLAAIATVAALIFRGRLFPPIRPRKAPCIPPPGVTDNQFAVMVLERDAGFKPDKFVTTCRALSAQEVTVQWRADR